MGNILKILFGVKKRKKRKNFFGWFPSGFEPGPPTGELFYKCKIILKPYFHLHSEPFSIKMVHWGGALIGKLKI